MANPRITVSTTRKINLGDYESQDVFICLVDIPLEASEHLIDSMLLTGEKAIKAISSRLKCLVLDARESSRFKEFTDGDI